MEDTDIAITRVLNEYATGWIEIEKDLAFSNEATLTADISDLDIGYWRDKGYIKGTLYSLGFRHIKINKDKITIKFKEDLSNDSL